jgi:hypothetical protein
LYNRRVIPALCPPGPVSLDAPPPHRRRGLPPGYWQKSARGAEVRRLVELDDEMRRRTLAEIARYYDCRRRRAMA